MQRQDNRRKQQAQELAAAKRTTDELKEANRRLQRQLAAASAGKPQPHQDDENDDMDGIEGPSPLTDEQRQAQISQIKASLPYLESHYGKEADEYVRATVELEVLQRAARDSKPYKTHRAQLERRIERLQKQQEADKEKAQDTEQQIETLRNTLGDTREAIQEREKAIAAAQTELNELLRSAIGGGEDGNDPNAQPTDVATSWRNVVATASSLAEKPGVPADWARQLQGLFGQLQSVVQAMETAAAAHDGADQAAHNEQMRQQQIEQRQLQAQLAQQQQELREQGLLPQLQPQQHATPTAMVQPAQPLAESTRQAQPELLALAPAPSPPPPPQSHIEPVSAEDMVARAMGTSSVYGATGLAEGASTGGQGTSGSPTAAGIGGGSASNEAAAATGVQDDELGELSDSEADDMAGVEVEVREGETVEQHRTRVRRLLKEKLQRARAAKEGKEDRKGNKCKDSKESKDKARPKASHKK